MFLSSALEAPYTHMFNLLSPLFFLLNTSAAYLRQHHIRKSAGISFPVSFRQPRKTPYWPHRTKPSPEWDSFYIFSKAPGGIGTYEEFFEIFTLKSLKRIDRPIVLYNIDGYYDKMKALLEYTAEEKFMDFSVLDLVVFLDEPTAVLDYLENYKK